jgi:hypothetical protein
LQYDRRKFMTWDELKLYLIGKLFLIGISCVDENDNLIEQIQTSGNVKELTDEGILILTRSDNSIFKIPYDNENISIAEKGEYRERQTGIIVVDPDYITSWTITIHDEKHLDDIRTFGFQT